METEIRTETKTVVDVNIAPKDLDVDKSNERSNVTTDFFQDIEKNYIVAGMGGKTATEWTSIIGHYAKRKGVKSAQAVLSVHRISEELLNLKDETA